MPTEKLQADYLVIGGGAMGVAFADELLARDASAHVIMVDKHARAGGPWNDAYSYVTLHQPAAFYGVNSENLGPGGAALVSGTEVLAYYERVMEKIQGTGRLRFFPLCVSDGENRFRSLVEAGREYEVEVRRKIVDATYMHVEVPSIRPPLYGVDDGVSVVPPNALHSLDEPFPGYVVVGAGKTGIDAVLFLLGQGIDPDLIEWVMPNDAWLIDRDALVPGKLAQVSLGPLQALAETDELDEWFRKSEELGGLLRLDPEVWPRKYRCATVNGKELEELRRVKKVVRMGRVVRIETDAVVLEEGTLPSNAEKLYVDCTADGLAKREARPVFDGNRITLQSLSMCQQVFSASVVGFVESRYDDEAKKNELCRAVPHPNVPRDYLLAFLVTNVNILAWTRAFPRWLLGSRLSMLHHDSLWAFLKATVKGQKLMKKAGANMERLLEKEFPGL
ncbi:MAG: FAD/NAD(P)-binding protein [Myxococcota bacterium]|nr:FAD/NAD(P)-binding protein [Myxococcota bacterium]